ncbi:MAG TPA: arginine deiminase family protein [Bryobacteraceae bacterium]|nr:arginine deiminase family protein [Bryobacteraceae bacterium]
MLIALTRGVSSTLGDCELQELDREPIDIAKAIEQHRSYEGCLEELGARVVALPADARFPDGVFVEDPALVLDEIAVLTRMGAESRRGEGESIANALAEYRPLQWIREPGTLEGGDVMRIGKTLYAGLSRRTNQEGIAQLREFTAPFGYQVIGAPVHGCLHLKSACCYLGDETILANRAWIDASFFSEFRIIDVPEVEPRAGNVLRVGETLILPEAFPKTRELLEQCGFHVRTVDVSELAKAEGAVTCTCILFDSTTSSR